MGRLLGQKQYRDLLLAVGLLCSATALVLWPKEAIEAMRDGLKLCGNVILPSLFPFLFSPPGGGTGNVPVSGAAVPAGDGPPLPRKRRLCLCHGLGVCGWIPCRRPHRHRPVSKRPVLQNRGGAPLGILQQLRPRLYPGGSGAGIFGSGMVGLLLYLVHIAASLLVGLLSASTAPVRVPAGDGFKGPSFRPPPSPLRSPIPSQALSPPL